MMRSTGVILVALLAGCATEGRLGVISRSYVDAQTAGRNHALVIGITDYRGTKWSNLPNATRDAEAVADALEHDFGYTVVRATSPAATTWQALASALERLPGDRDVDSLVIYYAGHGAVTLDVGCWIPSDSKGEPGTCEHGIVNSFVLRAIQRLQARHVLLLSDSCFSASMVEGARGMTRGMAEESYYRTKAERRSRHLIAASADAADDGGGLGAHSPFTSGVLQALERREAPFVAGIDILTSIERVYREAGLSYAATYSRINPGNDGGDIVFFRATSTKPDVAVSTLDAQAQANVALDLGDLAGRPRLLVAPFRSRDVGERRADAVILPLLDRTFVNALEFDDTVLGRLQRIDPLDLEAELKSRELVGGLTADEIVETSRALRADIVVDCEVSRTSELIVSCSLTRPGRPGRLRFDGSSPSSIGAVEAAVEAFRTVVWGKTDPVPPAETMSSLLLEDAAAAAVLARLRPALSSAERVELLDKALGQTTSLGIYWMRYLESPRDVAHLQKMAAAAKTHADPAVRAYFAELASDRPTCSSSNLRALADRYPILLGALAEVACLQRSGDVPQAVQKALDAHHVLASRRLASAFMSLELHFLAAGPDREIQLRRNHQRLVPEDIEGWSRLATAQAEFGRSEDAKESIRAARSLISGRGKLARQVAYHGAWIHLATLDFDAVDEWMDMFELSSKGMQDHDYWLLWSIVWHLRGEVTKSLNAAREGMRHTHEVAWNGYTSLATHAFYTSVEDGDLGTAATIAQEFKSRLAAHPDPGDVYGVAMLELALAGARKSVSQKQIRATMTTLGEAVEKGMGKEAALYERAAHECLLSSHLDLRDVAELMAIRHNNNKFVGTCRFRYAQSLWIRKDYPRAVSELQAAIREIIRGRLSGLGFVPGALSLLAKSQEALGRPDEALETYQRLVRGYGRGDRERVEVSEATRAISRLTSR